MDGADRYQRGRLYGNSGQQNSDSWITDNRQTAWNWANGASLGDTSVRTDSLRSFIAYW